MRTVKDQPDNALRVDRRFDVETGQHRSRRTPVVHSIYRKESNTNLILSEMYSR